MKEFGYVSIGRVFAKISRDYGIDTFNEDDVIEWSAEALEAIDAVTMLEECVAFIEVKNHCFEMPKYLNSVIQIARYTKFNEDYKKQEYFEEIKDEAETSTDCQCTGSCDCVTARYIPVDETGTPIFEQDRYEWKPNINVQAEYINWTQSTAFNRDWTPVRLADHSFFNSIVCEEDNTNNLYSNSQDEYTVLPNRGFRTSFKEGYVAISYLRQVLDEEGYPMIPDHYSYITAVTKYVMMKTTEREWYQGRSGAANKLAKLESDWNIYCGQAGSRAMMPRGIDAFQNLLDQSQYLLPRMFRYRQFFKDLNRPENRRYNDPDFRNNPKRGFSLGRDLD